MLLLNAGWRKSTALLANALSSLTAVLGGILGYFFLNASQSAIPYVVTLAAASFIYISVADLLPMLHRSLTQKFAHQAAWLLCGIAIFPVLRMLCTIIEIYGQFGRVVSDFILINYVYIGYRPNYPLQST